MAKRKRLTPANPDFLGAAPETKSMASSAMRAPIADVAAEASATAALEDLSREMQNARTQGRMITALPLSQIVLDHLVRDRIPVQDDDMAALVSSIEDRGQQTPIEVVALADGTYGLISGWRRCTAIAQLHAAGAHDGKVLALERLASEASDAYLAMVEENEIRVGLSYFERARIALMAVEQGVFETEKQALLSLFRTASRTKRSKIRSFLGVVRALDGALHFPQALGERVGLQLATALDADAALGPRLRKALAKGGPDDAAAEQKLLADALKPEKKAKAPAAYSQRDLRPGLQVKVHKADGRVELSGADMTPDFRARLMRWLEKNS